MALIRLIVTFSGFTLACSVTCMLLPGGSVKRSAVFAMGVMSMMIWIDGLFSIGAQEASTVENVPLLEASAGMADASDAFAECERLLSDRASAAAGCEAAVLLGSDGTIVSLTLPPCSDEAALRAARAVGFDASRITYTPR